MERKDYYILVVRNNLKGDIGPAINDFEAWLQRHTPLFPIITFRDINVPLNYAQPIFSSVKDVQAITGANLALKDIVGENEYDAVFLFSDAPEPRTYAWVTEPEKFFGETALISCPIVDYARVYRDTTHEIVHAFMKCLFWRGVAIKDDMDLYDHDDVLDGEGNRSRNLSRITEQYWQLIGEPPLKWTLVSLLKECASLLSQLVFRKTNLDKWAEAIKAYEGWFFGSRSFRNNNPGNLKFTGYTALLGATGQDDKGFARFATPNIGIEALKSFLHQAANGILMAYQPTMSLLDFFHVYAPSSDNNEPNAYAQFVAMKIGVPVTTPIDQIV